MKQLWINIPEEASPSVKEKLISKASEFADILILSKTDHRLSEQFNKTIAGKFENADIRIVEFNDPKDLDSIKSSKEIAAEISITTGTDEKKALTAVESGSKYIILKCEDWRVIPLENIIAGLQKKAKIIMQVSNPDDAKLAVETLELGADGVLYSTDKPEEITQIAKVIKQAGIIIPLVEAEVVKVKTLGTGARVCIDTCELLRPQEGILAGSQSSGLFLVESETMENPHVEPRPFRVNAGPASSYILATPEKTRYLSELKAGDEVLAVDSGGKTRMTNICRIKIEWRPMMMLEAKCEGRNFTIILQNAETVRLVNKKGSISVSEVKPGDKILMRVETGGRHFGIKVDEESVIER
ncbi:3-dehydroquinate synthase II [Candidatus Bathyarchaeota archaeon]|nr:3-dehydroquinate synthase II [Candidatus Bathyarchaeota archaeon]